MTATMGINYKYFSNSFFCFHVLNSPVNHIEIVQPLIGYVKNIHHVIIKGMGFLLSQKYIEKENIIYNIYLVPLISYIIFSAILLFII